MASRNAQLADAITAALNGVTAGTFNQPFTAKRSWVVSNDLASLKDLMVNVVAGADSSDRTARDVDEHELVTLIGVEKKITADPSTADANKEVDPLVELVEQISDFFGQTTIAESNGFFTNSTIQVLADPARLLNDKAYLGIVRITYLQAIAGA